MQGFGGEALLRSICLSSENSQPVFIRTRLYMGCVRERLRRGVGAAGLVCLDWAGLG